MKITFCGAAETVTGSCHLVEVDGLRVLLDCGFFQGSHQRGDLNREPFPFDAKSIDVVLLSHAHLDHCGRLPLLVQRGFAGKILCTPPTAEIAKLMLVDSAGLQMNEASYRERKARRQGKAVEPPLYDMTDVLRCAELFRPVDGYDQPVKLNEHAVAVFHDAGHILGSAAIELRTSDGVLLFSGDLGNRHQPIVKDPCVPPKVDVLLIESTYGDRQHRSMADTIAEFRTAIETIIPHDGNLLIPSFALERAQEVLYELFLLWKAGELPRCRIFLDSPLAISTTRVFGRYAEYFDTEGRAIFGVDPNPFHFKPLRFTQSTDESKEINKTSRGNIIIAGSGMCTGGRIIHHLRHNLWHKESGVLFVGYQAEGTLGRSIVDGEKKVHVYGEEIAVGAHIWTTNGFSSHADQPILLDWIKQAAPEKLILVHGEDDTLNAFAAKIKADLLLESHIAQLGEAISV
ncbi:MBL fold metallo-hydrolase [Candidatus Bipolaricaulota bacterium]|nr:MBL fold metallo-hydrolase [Candidatus Bipolaricaulota bacterium]